MKIKLLAACAAAVISVSLLSGTAEASSASQLKQHVRNLHHKRHVTHQKVSRVDSAARANVMAMIKQQAPAQGVPTWFALRIAKIESNYNPRARGLAGEYGVFQLKCQTARGIGFSGNCAGLLNASTNIRYGLKHLSMAVRSSHGNLKLAASKHNGGLGRKRLVPRYVAMVF